jgi:hypothetical protein
MKLYMENASWVAMENVSNMSKEILGQVNTSVTTLAAWAAIEGMFAS